MPTLNINGTRVKVDDSFMSLSPEQQNATVDEIAASLGAQGQGQSQPQAQTEAPAAREMGITEYTMQALPFGDEIGAAAAATGQTIGKFLTGRETDWSGDYEAARSGDKASREKIEAERPVATTLAQGAGIAAFGAPLPGATNAALAATLPRQIAQGVKGGLAVGGVTGAGEGDSLEERAYNAMLGAGIGAAGGVAVPVAISAANGMGKLGSRLNPMNSNAIRSRTNPNAVADDIVMSRLEKDGTTPMEVMARLRRAEDAGSPMALMDVAGDQTRRLARSVSNTSSRASERLNAFVEARKLDQPERVMENIRKAVGDPAAFSQTLDDVIATRSQAAKPLYDAAYAKPFTPSQNITGALNTPAGQTAVRRAQEMSANEGIEFALDVRGLDLVKRSLDDMIGTAQRSGERNQARILGGIRERIVREVDQAVPEYARARQVFSDGKAVEEAMQKGLTALRSQPDVLRREVSKMTAGEQDAFRLGFARALSDAVKNTPDGRNVVARLFGTQKSRELVRTAFKDERAYREFYALMKREAQMARTAQRVQGNSTTAQQMEDGADMVGTLTNLATGNFRQAAIDTFNQAFSRARGLNDQTMNRIVDMLTSSDPAQVQRVVQMIQQRKDLADRFNFAMRHLNRLVTNETAGGGAKALAN